MFIEDYRCETCAEIWEQTFDSREQAKKETVLVTCPVCGSGRTCKIMSAPALKIWWKDARSSVDSWQMRPSFRKGVRNKALDRR